MLFNLFRPKELYNSQSKISELISIMQNEGDINLLARKILGVLSTTFTIPNIAMIVVKDSQAKYIEFLGFSALGVPFSSTVISQIVTEQPGINLKEIGVTTIHPIGLKNERIAFLLLGEKSDKSNLTEQDLALLATLYPFAAISLKNAISLREVQEFNATLTGKVAERTRELEAAQAKELKLKDEFVFIATHDLATPVTAISGFAAMINSSQEPLSPTLQSHLKAITEASDRLKVLVNDLLQVARSDSGTIKLSLKPTNAKEIIESSIRQVTPLAQQKKITIFQEYEGNTILPADPPKLAEVIENLLSNAIKYNNDGGVVKVTLTNTDKSLAINIADNGLGIPESEHSKVFTKFYRSDMAEVRARPGTGLGLFVVRMLTEKMNGKISFVSKVGEGTTFTLTFPL